MYISHTSLFRFKGTGFFPNRQIFHKFHQTNCRHHNHDSNKAKKKKLINILKWINQTQTKISNRNMKMKIFTTNNHLKRILFCFCWYNWKGGIKITDHNKVQYQCDPRHTVLVWSERLCHKVPQTAAVTPARNPLSLQLPSLIFPLIVHNFYKEVSLVYWSRCDSWEARFPCPLFLYKISVDHCSLKINEKTFFIYMYLKQNYVPVFKWKTQYM